jgi:superfamily II DNA or RNA helicase
MNRDLVSKEIQSIDSSNILLELPTSFGKTKQALDLMNKRKPKSILILVPRLVLIDNWKEEFTKWKLDKYLKYVTFSTYVGIKKYKDKSFDMLISDECFRGDTEILTDKGFKRFDKLDKSELIAQYEDDGSIRFVKPINYTSRQHLGVLEKVYLGRNRYCYMTPNHNQVYRTSKGILKTTQICNMKFNQNNKLIVSGRGVGLNKSVLSPLERLLIAIQADGTLQRHQINESVYSIQVTKERKKERLYYLLQQYGNYTKIKGRPEVDRYMIKLPKGDAKLLSTHFDLNMSYTRAIDFIHEIVEWDGSKSMNNTLYYSSIIKENADFVAAVACIAGFKSLVSIEEDDRSTTYNKVYRVFMRKSFEVGTQVMKKESIDYNGMVYCVEVPSHKIVVRAEGYTFISGNCHHFTNKSLDIISTMKFKYSTLLSATVGKLKDELKCNFKGLYCYQVTAKKAIDEGILPDPRVYLIPYKLDNTNRKYPLELKNSSKGKKITCDYGDRWKYLKNKSYTSITVLCTQAEYIYEISSKIEYWKRMYMRSKNDVIKNKWLYLAGLRLKMLGTFKNPIVQNLQVLFKDYRSLTFCNSIEQTEILGKNCINSKNKDSIKILEKFNQGKVNHITSCNMINEGMNLIDCQVGIYASLNSSDTMIKQKLGRLLRHPNPVLIIPYYNNTREEEIIEKMLEDYNPELVTVVESLNQIKV